MPSKPEAPKAATVELPTVLYQDFRNNPLPAELYLWNVRVNDHVQFQPEGLLIQVPKTYAINPKAGIGLRTRFGLKGDFDIRATFVGFVGVSPPAGGGVHLGMYMHSLGGGDVQLSRAVRPNNNQGILWKWFTRPYAEGMTPSADNSGRLRFKRTKSTLYLMWAPGVQGDNFQTIHQCHFGNSDIGWAALNVNTSGAPCDITVRLLDWRFRGQIENTPAFTGSSEPPEPVEEPIIDTAKGGLAGALFIGLVITLAIALGVWLFIRRRRRGELTVDTAEKTQE